MKEANPYLQYYAAQAGGKIPVFASAPYQRGSGFGSLFRGLFKFVRPVAQALLPAAKKVAPMLAQQALETGKNIFKDVVSGEKSFKDSAKDRLSSAGRNIFQEAVSQITGSGVKRKRTKRKRQYTVSRRAKRSRLDIFN